MRWTKDDLGTLREFYRRELVENILTFWLRHSKDVEAGGYQTCLNRDGSVYDHDKICMWHAGRMIWTFSHVYNELAPHAEWIEFARWGVEFLLRCGFAPDGSLYYALTREGRPLQGPRDVYNDLSTVCGLSEFARATGDESLYRRARDIFLRVWELLQSPGRAFQPYIVETRPVRLHGHAMIPLNVLQELRRFRPEPEYDEMIDHCLGTLRKYHLRTDQHAVFEMVLWDGGPVPGSRGRWICPGHMIECGTFVIHEGEYRKDEALVRLGVDLIAWGFTWGWDTEFGGIYNDVDAEGLPEPTVDSFYHDAKLWWSHAEALYGLLLAYHHTGDEKFLSAYSDVHAHSFTRFADPEHGEWFTYLDRRGTRGNRSGETKGTAKKNVFHVGRNFVWCYRLLDRMTPESQ